MRDSYEPRRDNEGTGLLSEYEFPFKIEALSQLKVLVLDAAGLLVQDLRADDAVAYINSVEFDAVDGGGTVTLVAPLPAGYTLILLQANDAPDQPKEFKDKASFTNIRVEMALDWLGGAIQRLAYLVKGSIRLHDAGERCE